MRLIIGGSAAFMLLATIPAVAAPSETPRYYDCSPLTYSYSQEVVALPGTACQGARDAVVRVAVPPRGPLYNVPPVRVIVPLPHRHTLF